MYIPHINIHIQVLAHKYPPVIAKLEQMAQIV